jgi:hypothetical protein
MLQMLGNEIVDCRNIAPYRLVQTFAGFLPGRGMD